MATKYVSICSGCPKMSPLGTLPSAKCLWERDRIWLGGDLATDAQHIPEATMERRGKSCNSCHVSMPSPGTQVKATKLVAPALQNCEWQNRAGETCKFEPTYLFLMPGCTSYHKFVQLLHVEWHNQAIGSCSHERALLWLVDWLLGLGRASHL